MTPPVKTPAFLTIFFLLSVVTNAQLKIPASNSIAADVKRIIDDYPNHFDNLIGELIIENPQSADYQCNVKITGAEESIITKYSGKKNAISWHAALLTTERFSEAKKKFSSIYNQLNNLSVKTTHLKGVYESPVEEKKFTSIILSFDSADESLRKLKVEVVLEAEQMEWKVNLLIYGLGGVIVPFIGIKAIDLAIAALHLA